MGASADWLTVACSWWEIGGFESLDCTSPLPVSGKALRKNSSTTEKFSSGFIVPQARTTVYGGGTPDRLHPLPGLSDEARVLLGSRGSGPAVNRSRSLRTTSSLAS